MAAEELTNVHEFTESRPTRRRASRLSAEMIKEMFNSDTDCSDNDPDFDISEGRSKGRRSLSFRRSASPGSSRSEDADEPDERVPRKRQAKGRKRGRPSNETKAAKTPKRTGKLSSPVATSLPVVPGTPTPGNNAVVPPGTEVTQTPGNEEIRMPGNGAVVANGSETKAAKTPMRTGKLSSPVVTSPPHVPGAPTPGNNAVVPPGTEVAQTPGNEEIRMPGNGAVVANGSETKAAKTPKRTGKLSSPVVTSPPHVPGRPTPGNNAVPPPPMESPRIRYAEWNKDTDVIQPVRAPGKEYYCCVEGCVSGATSDKEGLWLFAMPENEQLMSAWDERLPIDYERNRPLSPRVCYRHFDKGDFVRRQQRLIGLKQDALPLKTERPDSTCYKKEPSS